jgi:hypothetical protein
MGHGQRSVVIVYRLLEERGERRAMEQPVAAWRAAALNVRGSVHRLTPRCDWWGSRKKNE